MRHHYIQRARRHMNDLDRDEHNPGILAPEDRFDEVCHYYPGMLAQPACRPRPATSLKSDQRNDSPSSTEPHVQYRIYRERATNSDFARARFCHLKIMPMPLMPCRQEIGDVK